MTVRWMNGVMLMALLFMMGIGAASVSAADTYVDPGGRFSFTVPDGYTPVTTTLTAPVVAGYVATTPVGANFVVQVRQSTGTLDAATAELQKRYTTASDSQPGPNGIQMLTLGGKPAERFDYFTNAQGSRFHVAQVVSINGGALYILVFTAQEADFDTLTTQTAPMLASFTFLGSGSTSPVAQVSNGSTVYSDPQGRFSFIIPIDFSTVTTTDGSIEFDAKAANGNLAAFFYLYVDDSASGQMPSFNSDVAYERQFLIDDRKYSILSEQGVTLGGMPGYRFDVTKTFPDDGTRVRSAFIFAASASSLYQITFVSTPSRFDEFSGRLQGLISSFSFSTTPNPITPPSGPAPASPTPPKAPAAPPVAPPVVPSAPTAPGPAATPSPDRDRG